MYGAVRYMFYNKKYYTSIYFYVSNIFLILFVDFYFILSWFFIALFNLQLVLFTTHARARTHTHTRTHAHAHTRARACARALESNHALSCMITIYPHMSVINSMIT